MSSNRFNDDDLFRKGFVPDGQGGYRKSNHSIASAVKPIIGNKKIRNAVKSEVDGIKFDSNLEKHMYGLLNGAGVTFMFQYEYLLQEKFKYGTENIRAITLTVDFFLPTKIMIIDTKGYMNDVAPLKYKMLKKHLIDVDPYFLPRIELPSTQKECDLLLNNILFKP